MKILTELAELRGVLIGELEQALKQGGGPGFYEATERLRAGDKLLEQAAILWRTGKEQPAMRPEPGNGHSGNFISAQTRAEQLRSEWVNRHLNKSLTRIRGNLYQNTRGEIVGIAYNKENPERRDHWFLGLPECRFSPEIKFQHVILLCHSVNDVIYAVCLPKDVIDQHRANFSKANRQVKFNVTKRDECWLWLVPRTPSIDVTKNINQFSLIV